MEEMYFYVHINHFYISYHGNQTTIEIVILESSVLMKTDNELLTLNNVTTVQLEHNNTVNILVIITYKETGHSSNQ